MTVAAHTMTVNSHPEANGTSWWVKSAYALMLPQLPCPNGPHQPNRSATLDKKAVPSDSLSASPTNLLGSTVCIDSTRFVCSTEMAPSQPLIMR